MGKRSCDRGDIDQRPCSLCLSTKKACTFSFHTPQGNPKLPSTDSARSTANHRNLYADEPKLASEPIYGSETAGIVDHVADRSEIANIALDFLRQIIGSSSSDLQKTLQDFKVSTQVMAWFEEQCQLYFEHLHHHWPVIHYTSFDIKNDPIVLVVIVILLGCLIRKQPCSGVLEAHSALTMRLYCFLVCSTLIAQNCANMMLL